MVAQDWQFELKRAQELAQEQNHPILLVFSGSDWCAPCIRMEKKIWQSDAFKLYSSKHLVLLKADFPRKKANQLSEQQQVQNRLLAEQYNPQGYFPFVVLINQDGKQTSPIHYRKKDTPEIIINRIKALQI